MTEPLDPLEPQEPTPRELERLQQALAPLQWRARAFHPATLPPAPERRSPWSLARPWPWLVAAAAALAIALPWAWSRAGAPALQPAAAARQYVAGERPLKIPLGKLAEITLRPGSVLDFVHWRSDQALFALRRGGLEAKVVPAPVVDPGFFQVETPLGRVIDQGCRYTLELDDVGGARIVVTEGAVSFTQGERIVFVPQGAELRVDQGGPRLPCFLDADEALRAELQAFERPSGKVKQPDDRLLLVQRLVDAVQRPRDSLVLWHLLRDPEPECRAIAEERLIKLVRTPYASKQESFDPEEWLPFLRLQAWQLPP